MLKEEVGGGNRRGARQGFLQDRDRQRQGMKQGKQAAIKRRLAQQFNKPRGK